MVARASAAAGVILPLLTLLGCGGAAVERPAAAAGPPFAERAAAAGIRHAHVKTVLDPRVSNIMPWLSSVGAAAAAGDFDNDGWVDLYVTSSGHDTPNFLYRNNGDGTFTDVAARAGVARLNDEQGASMACLWADLDNDGWADLIVVRWGRDAVFRNQGDGTFRDVTREILRQADGTSGAPWANGNAITALDHDLDGRLDLYVGNYFRDVDLWHLDDTRIMHDSFEVSRNAGRNQFWHQDDAGRLNESGARLGVDDAGWTLAVGAADLDNDGWPDLYAANDFGPDQLFYNDRRGGFVNASARAIGPDTRKGMNVDFGDFNNDGWLDIYVTNITTAEYLREGNMLWRNNGPDPDGRARFMDVARESGTYDGGWGWGAKFLDHDLDGDLDLFSANGFISAGAGSYWYDLASWTVLGRDPVDALNWPPIGDRSFSGHEPDRYFRNDGAESFTECAAELGLDGTRDGRGVVVFDYDNDGDPDLYVANQGAAPYLYRNDLPRQGRHWLAVRLIGDPAARTCRDAVGARVTVVTGARRQIRERDGGTGFAGQSDPRLHFGLGRDARVDLLEVRWPDGGLQYLENVAGDRLLVIVQDPAAYAGSSRVSVEPPERRIDVAQEPPAPALDPREVERALSAAEAELLRQPTHALARTYRRAAVELRRHDRAIEFFRARVGADPSSAWARLELSVAYVDKIPTCGGLAAIVCKGTLARQSLDQLDALLAAEPDSWIAHYARGMNHLHWPRALRHTPAAIDDFRRCLELQRGEPAARHHERPYVLLGDALAKEGSPDEARRIWQEGRTRFPDSAALASRLDLDDNDRLRAFVEEERSLERPIDTDLAFPPPAR